MNRHKNWYIITKKIKNFNKLKHNKINQIRK